MTLETDTLQSLAARAAAVADMTDDIPSPCISVCRMDAQRQYCEGCLRSIDEIRVWSSSGAAQKKMIWAQIAQRVDGLAAPTFTAP